MSFFCPSGPLREHCTSAPTPPRPKYESERTKIKPVEEGIEDKIKGIKDRPEGKKIYCLDVTV